MSRNVEVSASIFNLSPRVALTGDANAYRSVLHAMSVEGLQYSVMRNVRGRSVARELVRDGTITSFQQSWLTVKGLRDAVLSLAMPTLEPSLDLIAGLQPTRPRRPLRVIAHPNEQRLGEQDKWRPEIDYPAIAASRQHGTLLHQPSFETLKGWQVLREKNPEWTAQLMLERQREFGFGGVALDLNHLLMKRGGEQLKPWWCARFAGALAALGGLAGDSEVQLSIRPDFGGNAQDLQKAVDGRLAYTPHGETLQAIGENLPPEQDSILATLEVKSSAFNDVHVDGRFISYVEGNARLADALRRGPLAAAQPPAIF